MSSTTEEIEQYHATRLIADLLTVDLIDSAMAKALTDEMLSGQMPNDVESVVSALCQMGQLNQFQAQRLRKGGLLQIQFGPYVLQESLRADQTFGAMYLAVSKKIESDTPYDCSHCGTSSNISKRRRHLLICKKRQKFHNSTSSPMWTLPMARTTSLGPTLKVKRLKTW